MDTVSRRQFIERTMGLSLVSAASLTSCASKSEAQNCFPGGVIVPSGQGPSVFTKIIRGEIPCFKIFEDCHTFAFFPREQLNIGHTLIVPKIQIGSFLDVPEPFYSAVFENSKKIGHAILTATKCARVGTLIHGFEVPHFHYHQIPMFTPGDLWNIKPTQHTNAELLPMQKAIIAALGS